MVRCSNELRDTAEKLAKEKGQSLVEWTRRAIRCQIERESKPVEELMIDDNTSLRDYVRKVLREELKKSESD